MAAMAPFGIPRRPLRVNDNQPAVNWRRGLLRVWMLMSVAWIMGWLVYLAMYGIKGGFKGPRDLLEIPVLLLGPPVALLLFGTMARWALKGFAPDNGRPR
jgi:hypothetical protein